MKQTVLLFCILFLSTQVAFAQKNNLDVKSEAAMVFNTQNDRVIYDKNADKVMPIASITKLMTAMVTLDARLSPNERITITTGRCRQIKTHSSSRLPVGSSYPRQ
jgi:D-alanyl-D-alanine endopeptidase (penicillin-binding protein 7)